MTEENTKLLQERMASPKSYRARKPTDRFLSFSMDGGDKNSAVVFSRNSIPLRWHIYFPQGEFLSRDQLVDLNEFREKSFSNFIVAETIHNSLQALLRAIQYPFKLISLWHGIQVEIVA